MILWFNHKKARSIWWKRWWYTVILLKRSSEYKENVHDIMLQSHKYLVNIKRKVMGAPLRSQKRPSQGNDNDNGTLLHSSCVKVFIVRRLSTYLIQRTSRHCSGMWNGDLIRLIITMDKKSIFWKVSQSSVGTVTSLYEIK